MHFNNKPNSKVCDQLSTHSPEAAENLGRKTVAGRRSCAGHSLVELLLVIALVGAVTSIALPQLLTQRRLSRSIGVTREILTQLREARQLAMSQRQAFTFQYDNVTKQISIIDHNANPGPATLINGSYATTANTRVISKTLIADPATSADITYGIPSGLPAALPPGLATLGDKIQMTALDSNNQINITFQPDGSVVDAAGDPQGRAMFIHNIKAPEGTASAISIMGASGRVKIWRYNRSANRYAD